MAHPARVYIEFTGMIGRRNSSHEDQQHQVKNVLGRET